MVQTKTQRRAAAQKAARTRKRNAAEKAIDYFLKSQLTHQYISVTMHYVIDIKANDEFQR